MRRLYFPLLLLVMLLTLSGCMVKSYVVLNPPQEPGIDCTKIDSLVAEYPDDYALFSVRNRTVEYGSTVVMDREVFAYFETIENEYIILDPTNEYLNQFSLSFPGYQKLQSLYLRVLYPDGTVNAYTRDDCILERLSNGYLRYKISYPNIVKGAIIQEGYQIREDFTQNNYHFSSTVFLDIESPCLKSTFTMNLPQSAGFYRKKVAEEEPFVKTKKNVYPGRVVTSYTMENLEAYEKESYSPYRRESGRYIQYKISKLGSLDLSQTWDELFTSILESVPSHKGKKFFWGTRFDEIVDSLTVNEETKMAQIRNIVNYLQDNLELAWNGNQNIGTKILRSGEANPYQFCGVAKLMLAEIDVSSELIICHLPLYGYLDRSFVDLEQYPIPGLRIKLDGEYHYSFPYFAYLKWNQIPSDLSEQPAIVVSKPYEDAEKFTLPEAAAIDNIVEEEYEITIQEDGKLHVKQVLGAHGGSAYSLRNTWEELEAEEQDKMMDTFLTWKNINVEDFTYELTNLEKPREPLYITFEYTVDNLMSIMMDEAIMQTGGLLEPASIKRYKIDAEKRKNDIAIYEDEVYTKIIDIQAPEGWTLQSELKDVNFSNQFGEIQGTYRADGNHLHIEQTRKFKRSFAPKEKYSDLLKLGGKRSKLIIPTLIFDIDLS